MKASLAVSALRHAVGGRSPVATIVHSDQTCQFRSSVHTRSHNGLRGSMTRVGACGDNVAMESLFALLQRNVLDRQRWSTRAELRLAIVTWIERTYHRRRRQGALGKLTPIEFELLHTSRNRGLKFTPRESTKSGAVPNVFAIHLLTNIVELRWCPRHSGGQLGRPRAVAKVARRDHRLDVHALWIGTTQ